MSFLTVHGQSSPQVPPGPVACQGYINGYLEDQSALLGLANPIIRTPQELEEKTTEVAILLECLNHIPNNERNQDIANLAILGQYFMIFTDSLSPGSQNGELRTINLTESEDPAVTRLRDDIGLKPPEGWIFIKYYPSREAMPAFIRAAFENPQVAAVTFLSRYVAILLEPSGSWVSRTLQEQRSANILSHELVHAYVNSLVLQNQETFSADFPIWFDEGLASYISESNRPSTIITPSLSYEQTDAEDYQTYALMFEYLENRYGRDRLDELIRHSILSIDSSMLYKGLGITDDRWLEASAIAWRDQKWRITGIIGLIVIIGLVASLSYYLPELECECGYTGRRRDFINRKCPVCDRPIPFVQLKRLAHSDFSIITQCQVCKRRFLPWERKITKNKKHLTKVWINNPAGTERPLAIYVKSVCNNCLSDSQNTFTRYKISADKMMNEERESLRQIFKKWLADAPVKHSPLAAYDTFSFDQVLEEILTAALAINYVEWMDQPVRFKFVDESDLFDPDHQIYSPPDDYDHVIIHLETKRLGSIFRDDQKSILICWE